MTDVADYLGDPRSGRVRVTRIVQGLLSNDEEERLDAADKLRKFDSPDVEALRIGISEATGRFPSEGTTWSGGAVSLMAWVSDWSRPELVERIEAVYPQLPLGAKFYALRALVNAGSERGLLKAFEIFETAADGFDTTASPFSPLAQHPQLAHVAFPRLVLTAKDGDALIEAEHVLLAHLQAGQITVEQRKQCEDVLLGRARCRLSETQQVKDSSRADHWYWSEENSGARSELGLLLDIFGYFDCEETLRLLFACLDVGDPWLKHFAVVSLLRRDSIVPRQRIEEVAGESETRGIFFHALQRLGRATLFPSRWFSREAFAESDMVRWLVFPTELGRPPDAIELMGRFEVATDGGDGEFFVYRFKTFEPHWAAESGWMAGVAGPYLLDRDVDLGGGSGTFSQFKPWDEASALGHLQEILGD